ncbi:MAG: ribosome recycling factor [Geovibrio sp.]|nr:ribosome recycling factor [Geovibrio sp.]
MRNIRRDANDELKKLEKDKAISEDDCKKGQDKVQEITNDFVKKIDAALDHKEKRDNGDLMPDILPVHLAIIMDGNGRWAKQRKNAPHNGA